MKERPILFSAPMVRAILDGSKTQTRRVCKPMNAWVVQDCREVRMVDGVPHHFMKGATAPLERLYSPYGQPGDRLWVKETHLAWWKLNPDNPDGPRIFSHVAAFAADGYELEPGEKWIPSIHMRRAASRILLEVTGVRVERLQDISINDIRAEGAITPEWDEWREDAGNIGMPEGSRIENERDVFYNLWESINGAGSWDANPWVWVVEFRRIARIEDER